MNEFALEELKRCEVEKYDCAACHEGRCVALNDTRFKTGVCPFYKTKGQNDAEQKACMERLKALPNGSIIINKYHQAEQ